MKIITHVVDALKGKHPIGIKRSNHWSKVRQDHLVKNPYCAVCHGTDKLQVHHKEPFHLNPEKELDPNNLITLCEGSTNCHLLFGHLKNFKSFNENVEQDASIWNTKISERPKP